MTRAWLAKVRMLVAAGWTVKVVFTSKAADEAAGGWRGSFTRLCGDLPLPEVEARWLWSDPAPVGPEGALGGAALLAGWIHEWETHGSAPVLFVDSPAVLPVAAHANDLYNAGGAAEAVGQSQVLSNRTRGGVPQFGARMAMTMHLNHLSYDADPVTGSLTTRFADRIEQIRTDVDRLVVLTHRQAADLAARYPELAGRTEVIGQPCPTIDRGILPPRSAAPLCSVVARLDPNKRLDALIELWPAVVRAVPGARLEIWGTGPDLERLAGLVSASPASGSIQLAGFTPSPLAQMARAWCTVSTSKREAMPLAIMESLAVGTPVVAFDVRYGPSELIRHGVDGFLIGDRDRTAMANVLAELLASRSMIQNLGARALGAGGVAERFAADGVSLRWCDLADALSRVPAP